MGVALSPVIQHSGRRSRFPRETSIRISRYNAAADAFRRAKIESGLDCRSATPYGQNRRTCLHRSGPAPHDPDFRLTDRLIVFRRAFRRPTAALRRHCSLIARPIAAVHPSHSRPVSPLLRFENVGLRYGMGEEVVSDVNFAVAPQSFQFLTGPSGAGKTTLLRLMLLSLRPTRGTIHIFGQDSATLTKDELTGLRRRIGVVFQDFRLLDHLTTYENVALPLRALGRAESSYRAEVLELLRWVGLGERMNAVAARSVRRRKAARRHRTRADRPTRAAARRRADRQRRPGPRAPSAAPVRRASPAGHRGRDCDA